MMRTWRIERKNCITSAGLGWVIALGLITLAAVSTKNEGDLEVTGDLKVTGEAHIGPTAASLNVDSQGDVGINTLTAIEDLELGGNDPVIAIEELGTSPPGDSAGYAKLYVDEGEMYVLDEDDNETQLSSHADPRDYGEPISTSFNDPTVGLPFSFHHKNRILGKGAVVDLAAAVRDLEAITGKSYTTIYDLANSTTEELIVRYDWIEIPIGEAWEEAEVMVVETVTEYRYDLESEEVYAVEIPTGEPSREGTGGTQRQLKENVRFDKETGKFYRRPTEADIGEGATPNLPSWIVDRLSQE